MIDNDWPDEPRSRVARRIEAASQTIWLEEISAITYQHSVLCQTALPYRAVKERRWRHRKVCTQDYGKDENRLSTIAASILQPVVFPAEIRPFARPVDKPTSMSSCGTIMVAKSKDGSFGLRLCVPGPGDPVMAAHSASSHRTKCAMALKTMKLELVRRRRNAPTASTPGSRRVSTPPYRNPGYKPSDDAYWA